MVVVVGAALKNARTVLGRAIVTAHVGVVPQGAFQRANAAPEAGVAMRTSFAPLRADSVHLGLQWIPAGFEVTVPRPTTATVSVTVGAAPAAPTPATSAKRQSAEATACLMTAP